MSIRSLFRRPDPVIDPLYQPTLRKAADAAYDGNWDAAIRNYTKCIEMYSTWMAGLRKQDISRDKWLAEMEAKRRECIAAKQGGKKMPKTDKDAKAAGAKIRAMLKEAEEAENGDKI